MKNKVISNTVMLYLMTFAKMIFPLLTLPYLTRVLSVDGYAVVSYVKSAMTYMQIFIDFGFLLSATKEIVLAHDDKEKISEILSKTIAAKAILAIVGLGLVVISIIVIPILSENWLYTILSYITVALTLLLPDFLFRGIEKMHIITIRFIIMRGIATALTFICIKSDASLLLIPILDIIGTIIAIIWTWHEIGDMGFKLIKSSWRSHIQAIKTSFVYFVSDASTTAFSALNTLLIGIYLSKIEISFWSVSLQLVSAVQSMYSPINNGIYPHMVRNKNIKFVLKVFSILFPIVVVGTAFCYCAGETIIIIVSGEKYREAVNVFNWLLPLLIISFPSMLFGWPCLGAIDKQKQVTFSTMASALIQIVLLIVLIATNSFTLINIALARVISEAMLLLIRLYFCFKYRCEFNIN